MKLISCVLGLSCHWCKLEYLPFGFRFQLRPNKTGEPPTRAKFRMWFVFLGKCAVFPAALFSEWFCRGCRSCRRAPSFWAVFFRCFFGDFYNVQGHRDLSVGVAQGQVGYRFDFSFGQSFGLKNRKVHGPVVGNQHHKERQLLEFR